MKVSISVALVLAPFVYSQTKPYQGQSTSSISVSTKGRAQNIDISNVAYELTGTGIPGRPKSEQLVLRKLTKTKQVVDEIGMEASTTVEAWPLGTELRQKPLYMVATSGVDPVAIDAELLQISRGLEDTEWWSLYKLGTGEHLLDTYVPLLKFSISREILTARYVGLEVPPDDTKDARLKDPKVIAVLSYASGEKIIREALLTADDLKQAQLLRSYADSTRIVEIAKQAGVVKAVVITISQSFPSPANPITLTVPIASDDLDLAHAQVPARLHVTAWKR